MTKPKILIFDIETAPNLGYIWGMYEQNVIEFKNEWYMLSFTAKWLGEKPVTYALPDFKGYKPGSEDDKALVTKLWELFDEADIIVAHNGDEFDIKKSNARFTYHKLNPPTPYKTVDTKKVAKKYFSFNSNSLNNLGKHLGLGEKVETGGFKTWKGCMDGDKKAWDTMKKYNKQDVILLEKVYLRLLPWMTNHPNSGMFSLGREVCSNCSSTRLQSRGFAVTKTSKYRRVQCQDCGAWGRESKSETIVKPIVSV